MDASDQPSTLQETFRSESVEHTEQIAGQISRRLKPGDCIALEGNLGAGKTQFVRGLAVALGVEVRAVNSPTYVLLNIYQGKLLKVYHLDAYRATSAEDFEAIGFTELLEQGGIVVVEWASRVKEILPERRIEVLIESRSETEREIAVKWA